MSSVPCVSAAVLRGGPPHRGAVGPSISAGRLGPGRPAGACAPRVLAWVSLVSFRGLVVCTCVSCPRRPQPGGVSHSNMFRCWGSCCSLPRSWGEAGWGLRCWVHDPSFSRPDAPPPPAPLACRERSVRLSFPVWPVPSLPGPTSVLGKGAGRPLGEAPRGGVGGGSPGGDTLGWGARPCALPGQPGERRADSAGPRSRPRNRGLGWEAWGALSFLCISWGPSPWVSATGTSGAAARGQADQSRAPAPGETEAGPRGAARMSLPPPPAPAERPLGPKGARGRQGATRRLLTRLWLDSAPYGNCPRCQESPWLTRRHHFLKVEALGEVGAAGD